MENELLNGLYDCFYTPPELSEQENEVEECHKALIAALEKPERKLVLRIIDAQDSIIEQTIQKVLAVQKIRPCPRLQPNRKPRAQSGRIRQGYVQKREQNRYHGRTQKMREINKNRRTKPLLYSKGSRSTRLS